MCQADTDDFNIVNFQSFWLIPVHQIEKYGHLLLCWKHNIDTLYDFFDNFQSRLIVQIIS